MGSSKKSSTQTQNSSTTFSDHDSVRPHRNAVFGMAGGFGSNAGKGGIFGANTAALGPNAKNRNFGFGGQNSYFGIGDTFGDGKSGNNPVAFDHAGMNSNYGGTNNRVFGLKDATNPGLQQGQTAWQNQQLQAHQNTINSARMGQDYYRDVLSGNYLEADKNPALQRHLTNIQNSRLDNAKDFQDQLASVLQGGGAYQNANAGDLGVDAFNDFNTPYDLAMSQALLGNYAMERGYQQQALPGLQQAHGMENLVHDVRQQDQQNRVLAAFNAPMANVERYNALLNANRLGQQDGTATTTMQTTSQPSPIGTIFKAGLLGAGLMGGGPLKALSLANMFSGGAGNIDGGQPGT